MQGFKSFPEKTVLQFGKGVTTGVGPNGSGKSNIGDAVRWVLGEQSTKMLRGGKMEDVIFSGTELRKPVSFAAVTLNIANFDHVLNVDSEVVSVTRKLYRNGDSEYLINGNNVRLKDIVELFMDTGLGRDGYSIIGQGRIADIVGSKSNERREIFDEAAGISKFRYKKAESERRLASAEDNILRLKDILAELEGRVEPLRIQSEKAKKYLVLAGERKVLEISVWARRLSELKGTLSDLEDKLLASKGEYEFLSNELLASEEELEQLALMRRQCTVASEEQRERIERLNQENSTANADIAVFKNNIMHYNLEIEGVEAKKQELSLAGTETETKIAEKKAYIASIEEYIKKISEETQLLESRLVSLTNEADEYSKALAEKGDELNKLYIKRSEIKFNIENSKITEADCKEAVEKATAMIAEAKTARVEVEAEHKEILDGIAYIDNQITEHNNKLGGFNMLFGKKSETLKTASAELNSAELNIRGLEERMKMLQDLENSMEGFAGSVKSVISAGKSGRIKGVRGTVAQLISVDSKYGVAIETALGGGLQNIIVQNEDSAKAGIRFLQETNGGRATFLPITSVKGNELYEKGLDMQEGFVALASELV
ncbi:MAG: AAA family ATPase, partial [Oscillospiraceae bacterium]|nr:AAA family ATPase [Oscillospiraceae bacterium]